MVKKTGSRVRIAKRKDETLETVCDAIGRIQVVKVSSPRGSRLIIAMNLEDDPIKK